MGAAPPVTTLVVVGPEEGSDHAVAGHPEGPGRVQAAMAGVKDLHAGDDARFTTARDATFDELARVHTQAYLLGLEAVCRAGGGQLDPDTYALPGSWGAARRAARRGPGCG